MKKLIKLFGIIALFTLIWFPFISCDLDEQTVTISGTPKVGYTLTATQNKSNWSGRFYWELSNLNGVFDGNSIGNGVMSADTKNYEIWKYDDGKSIRAYIIKDNGEKIFSNVLGPIEPAN